MPPPPLARAAPGVPRDEQAPGTELPSGVSLDDGRLAVRGSSPVIRSYYLDLTVEPARAWLALDGRAVGMGRIQRKLRADGAEHILVVGAAGYAGRMFKFRDAPPPSQVVLERRIVRFGGSGVEAADPTRCGEASAPSAR